MHSFNLLPHRISLLQPLYSLLLMLAHLVPVEVQLRFERPATDERALIVCAIHFEL